MDKDMILQEKEAEVIYYIISILRLYLGFFSTFSVVLLASEPRLWAVSLTCLLFCAAQLRRMQEMIAKMQAQMQRQGDGEGDGPHMWTKGKSRRRAAATLAAPHISDNSSNSPL